MPIIGDDPNAPADGGGGGGAGGDAFNPPPPPGGTDGGGGGGGGGGSSSGGGGAPIEIYIAILQSLGIPLDERARAFARRAAAQRWSQAEFLVHLRRTNFYERAFPGIMGPNGELRMSEAQYIQTRRAYEDIAAALGMHLSSEMIERLFRLEVSPAIFRMRAQAVRSLKDNAVLFRQFAEVLERKGEKVKRKDLLRFVTGMGPGNWYRTWQEAQARAAAVQAGLTIGRGELAVGGKLVRKLGRTVSPDDLARGFEELADLVLSVLPESQIRGAGLSKKDIARAVFGGKRAAEARDAIRRLAATIEEFETAERALPQLAPSAEGPVLIGRRRSEPVTE